MNSTVLCVVTSAPFCISWITLFLLPIDFSLLRYIPVGEICSGLADATPLSTTVSTCFPRKKLQMGFDSQNLNPSHCKSVSPRVNPIRQPGNAVPLWMIVKPTKIPGDLIKPCSWNTVYYLMQVFYQGSVCDPSPLSWLEIPVEMSPGTPTPDTKGSFDFYFVCISSLCSLLCNCCCLLIVGMKNCTISRTTFQRRELLFSWVELH